MDGTVSRAAEHAPDFSAAQRGTTWLNALRTWHWISSALCLVGMLLFAATGITLNHASQISAEPQTLQLQAQLPADLLAALQVADAEQWAPLPAETRDWLSDKLGHRIASLDAEWSTEEVYLSLPRAGGDAWLAIDLASGQVEFERTDRGWIAYFNDLHKGRHTGPVWTWFIDLLALACLVFSVTGLLLLQRYSAQRASTWPTVSLGLLLPFLLALLFVH